jgi:hypothetical protein
MAGDQLILEKIKTMLYTEAQWLFINVAIE